MNPVVVKLAKRAIVDYMAGNMGEFERLSNLALEHNKEMICSSCNGIQVPCGYWIKGTKYRGYVCLKCGQVIDFDGIKLRSGKRIC